MNLACLDEHATLADMLTATAADYGGRLCGQRALWTVGLGDAGNSGTCRLLGFLLPARGRRRRLLGGTGTSGRSLLLLARFVFAICMERNGPVEQVTHALDFSARQLLRRKLGIYLACATFTAATQLNSCNLQDR